MTKHVFGKFEAEVDDDIGEATVEFTQETFVVSDTLTDETRAITAKLFQFCRQELAGGARPIPLQQALRITHEAMGDPDGVGIRKQKSKR